MLKYQVQSSRADSSKLFLCLFVGVSAREAAWGLRKQALQALYGIRHYGNAGKKTPQMHKKK